MASKGRKRKITENQTAMRFFSHKPLPRPAAPSGGIDPDEAALARQRYIIVSIQI